MRLTAIRNESKQIIFASGGFELLQMVLEPDIERYASEDAGPQGVDCEIPHRSVGEENETFFKRLWKPLPSRRVLKP